MLTSRRTSLFLSFIILTNATSADGLGPEGGDDAEQRFYDLVSEFAADWHEIAGRYAVVFDGEGITSHEAKSPLDPPISQSRITYLQSVDLRRNFKTSTHLVLSGRLEANGGETLLRGGRMFTRRNSDCTCLP